MSNYHCACKFRRIGDPEFGSSELVEACAYHSKQASKLSRLEGELQGAEDEIKYQEKLRRDAESRLHTIQCALEIMDGAVDRTLVQIRELRKEAAVEGQKLTPGCSHDDCDCGGNPCEEPDPHGHLIPEFEIIAGEGSLAGSGPEAENIVRKLNDECAVADEGQEP